MIGAAGSTCLLSRSFPVLEPSSCSSHLRARAIFVLGHLVEVSKDACHHLKLTGHQSLHDESAHNAGRTSACRCGCKSRFLHKTPLPTETWGRIFVGSPEICQIRQKNRKSSQSHWLVAFCDPGDDGIGGNRPVRLRGSGGVSAVFADGRRKLQHSSLLSVRWVMRIWDFND